MRIIALEQLNMASSSNGIIEYEPADMQEWATLGNWTTPYFGYVNSVEEAETVLKNFTEATKTKYVVYQKEKTFGAQEFNFTKSRIFFKGTEERQTNPKSVYPEFDGIPFVVLGRKNYGCHLGKDKDYIAKLKLREIWNQTTSQETAKIPVRTTKKLGCPAKINMVQIVKFPEYKVEQVESEGHRREIFRKLHNDVRQNPSALKFEVRYYIKLSKPEDHSHYVVKCCVKRNFCSSMDYRLVRHLCHLHHQGVSRLSEIETRLSQYIENTLYPNGDAPAKGIYDDLYPDHVTLQYHINNAKRTEQLIHIDTQIFNNVIEEWRDLYPTHSFYYQAYVKEPTRTEQQVKDHHYAREMVEPGKLQSFMFCYQSDIQQRLLARFGQCMAVFDITKKIPIPTYFLMVRTNTCYQVVAMISLQYYYAPYLKQALTFLREVNPGWNPQYLMVHNTHEDIDVLEELFPDAEICVLDSCREKSWKKYLARNCVENSAADTVFELLQETARSKTEVESNQAWEKVTQLGLWRFNASFKYYLNHSWIRNKKRWCHYFRSDALMMTLTANGGLQQLANALQHDWLDDLKTRSLTEIFSGIVNNYLPTHYYKHMSQNLVLPALANHNSKKPSVRAYVKNAPPLIQAHILELLKRMPPTAEVTRHASGVFTITFPDRPSCTLSFGNELRFPLCTCPYWQETLMICKHFCVIFGSFPDYGWDKMSVRYINNPLFLVDEESLPAEIQTLFKVDSLQQQAEITHSALKAVKQVKVGGKPQGTEMDEMEENEGTSDASDGESNLPIPQETQHAEPTTVDEETATASQNITFILAAPEEEVAGSDDRELASDVRVITSNLQQGTSSYEASEEGTVAPHERLVPSDKIIESEVAANEKLVVSDVTFSELKEGVDASDEEVIHVEMVIQKEFEMQHQVVTQCKQHLERLGHAVDHISNVDALIMFEQQLAGFVQEVEKIRDAPASKRRKIDPD